MYNCILSCKPIFGSDSFIWLVVMCGLYVVCIHASINCLSQIIGCYFPTIWGSGSWSVFTFPLGILRNHNREHTCIWWFGTAPESSFTFISLATVMGHHRHSHLHPGHDIHIKFRLWTETKSQRTNLFFRKSYSCMYAYRLMNNIIVNCL